MRWIGDHLIEGVAGESILIESDKIWQVDEMGIRLAIRSLETGQLIYLGEIIAAAPCVEFSHFSLNQPEPSAENIKEALQLLDERMRGFYATSADETTMIQAGDSVFRLD